MTEEETRSALLVALLSAVSLFVLHGALQRFMTKLPRQRAGMIACAAGVVPLLLLVRAMPESVATCAGAVYLVVFYACAAYTYFLIYNMSETARRVRLVREIDRRKSMSEAELRVAYKDNEVVDARLERMTAMGHLRDKGGRYVVGSFVFHSAARILDLWRGVLGYERGPQ